MPTDLYLIAPPDAEAAPFVAILERILAAVPIAALLLPRGTRVAVSYADFARAVIPVAQAAGCAVLLTDDEPRLAVQLGADGLHVDGPSAALGAALTALKPDRIVGATAGQSSHDAMTRGEMGPDYIMFGPLSGATAPETRELAGWWAEAMVIPSVLSDPEANAATADAAGCEFFAVGESIWASADPVAAVAGIAAALERQD